jgi:hypothetical protein
MINKKLISNAKEKLTVAYSTFEFYRQELILLLSEHTDFEIDIIFQPGDGFTVLDVESGSDLAPLDTCIRIIKKEGNLTREEFKNHCI